MTLEESTDAHEPRYRIELVAALLLGVATVLTAFAAYQSALKDGESLAAYTDSASSLADANFFYSQGNTKFTSDQSLFLEYAVAAQDDPDLALYIRDSFFSPELEAATLAWEGVPLNASPPTPLATEEYVVPDFVEAERLEAQAKDELREAEDAGDTGDKFQLAAVFLAVALFLAGIATLFRSHRVRVGTLALSGAALVPGVIVILSTL